MTKTVWVWVCVRLPYQNFSSNFYIFVKFLVAAATKHYIVNKIDLILSCIFNTFVSFFFIVTTFLLIKFQMTTYFKEVSLQTMTNPNDTYKQVYLLAYNILCSFRLVMSLFYWNSHYCVNKIMSKLILSYQPV